MRHELAIYDWNGTLANDLMIGYACVVEIFRVFAPDLVAPTLAHWRTENGNVNFLEFYYRNGIPRSMTIDDLRAVWFPHYSLMAISQKLSLADGALEVLLFCQERNVPNVIVSSSIDDVEQHLKQLNAHHLFHAVHVKVPDKKVVLLQMVEHFGISPDEAFYVNDTFDGLVDAKEIGMTAIGFTGGFEDENRVGAANPHHVISSFRKLPQILAEG